MSNETKTHWRKNNDSKFISGEDLKAELNGLKSEMLVSIEKFSDAETFDQNKQAKTVVTGLWLKDHNTGKALYKPAILNKTNAKFFVKETGSDFIDDWIGRPVILFALKDSRHGWVTRFKTYIKPTLIKDSENFTKVKQAMANGYTMDQVKSRYVVSKEVEDLLK